MTTDEVFNLLRYGTKGKFFSVTFERRTTRRDGSAIAGELRTILCKTAGEMSSYKLGHVLDVDRDREDFRNAVLTVWDIQAFLSNKRQGMSQSIAGQNAFRRIDVTSVQRCSAIDNNELPPSIRIELHQITNQFRLQNLPTRV